MKDMIKKNDSGERPTLCGVCMKPFIYKETVPGALPMTTIELWVGTCEHRKDTICRQHGKKIKPPKVKTVRVKKIKVDKEKEEE